MSAAIQSDCSRLNAGTDSATGIVYVTEYGTAVQQLRFAIYTVQAMLQGIAVLQSDLQISLCIVRISHDTAVQHLGHAIYCAIFIILYWGNIYIYIYIYIYI